ncbi:MAG: hypothetical protein II623_08435 [Paludibacteraceae bacterium]|nr:hypothetical protein [Paludibacteraceae bacterium]MBR6043246.1 hypothetical protein [Paludibacteraceae bacterium]
MAELDFSGLKTCKGKAYISVYNFSNDFVASEAFQTDFLKGKYDGGFGAVIYIDFKESPVGPYQEVLFIPGKYEVGGESRYVATKCYVSTPEAINNNSDGYFGHKELGTFHWTTVGENTMHLSIHKGRTRLLTVEIGSWSGFSLPASSNIITFPFMQILSGDERLLWKYSAKSSMNLARLVSVQVRPAFFPDIAKYNPIVTLCFDNFELNFEPESV